MVARMVRMHQGGQIKLDDPGRTLRLSATTEPPPQDEDDVF